MWPFGLIVAESSFPPGRTHFRTSILLWLFDAEGGPREESFD